MIIAISKCCKPTINIIVFLKNAPVLINASASFLEIMLYKLGNLLLFHQFTTSNNMDSCITVKMCLNTALRWVDIPSDEVIILFICLPPFLNGPAL